MHASHIYIPAKFGINSTNNKGTAKENVHERNQYHWIDLQLPIQSVRTSFDCVRNDILSSA